MASPHFISGSSSYLQPCVTFSICDDLPVEEVLYLLMNKPLVPALALHSRCCPISLFFFGFRFCLFSYVIRVHSPKYELMMKSSTICLVLVYDSEDV